jgi:YHS domain-containing protein/class 3 adenylate cyclase
MSAKTCTFLIVDLVGYTALTEIHGNSEAADEAGALFKAARTLLSATTKEAAEVEGSPAHFRPAGSHAVKNIAEPIELFSICLGRPESGLVIDPVCRMLLAVREAPFSRSEPGGTVYFCSSTCADEYLRGRDN